MKFVLLEVYLILGEGISFGSLIVVYVILVGFRGVCSKWEFVVFLIGFIFFWVIDGMLLEEM